MSSAQGPGVAARPFVLLAAAMLGACAGSGGGTKPATEPRFRAEPRQRLAEPGRAALLNTGGDPRIRLQADYDRFRAEVAPLLEEWGRDPRLAISPAYVAALLAKESGFEPYAVSGQPAHGYAQLTPVADAHLQEVVRGAPDFAWMAPEVLGWPRSPAARRREATREQVLALLERGEVSGLNEYFYAPTTAARAAVFWLRVLEAIWTGDEWPGEHGRLARDRLNGGLPLRDGQLLDLVTVSYNQGYPYAAALVSRHGREWTAHLHAEPADHLERIRAYTVLFQGGR